MLNKKHAVIISSSNNIGISVLERFRSEGWRVSHSTRQGVERSDSGLYLDVTSDVSVDKFCDSIMRSEPIDVLVVLCGVLSGESIKEKSDLDIERDFTINAISPIKIVKRLLDHFTGEGRVIFLNSISAFNGSYDVTYAASKAAIVGFVKSMAKHGPPNIHFNAIAPGLIEDSRMATQFSDQDMARHRAETPSGVLNRSKDIAGIIFDICGPSWKNLNGQVIHINGGRYV